MTSAGLPRSYICTRLELMVDAGRWGQWVEPRDAVLVLDSLWMMEQISHGLPDTEVVSEILDVLNHLTWLLA